MFYEIMRVLFQPHRLEQATSQPQIPNPGDPDDMTAVVTITVI